MKLLISALLLMASSISLAEYKGTPIEIFLPAEQVNIIATENNKNFEMVLDGFLPNFCQKQPTIDVNLYDKLITIDIKTLSYDPSNPFCPDALKAFTKRLYFDQLPAGDYDIVINEHTDYQQNFYISIIE